MMGGYAMAGGLVTAGVGLFAYLVGDDPGRYDVETSVQALGQAPETSTWHMALVPGGIVLGGTY